MYLLHLATDVEWEYEKDCFENFSRETARFYADQLGLEMWDDVPETASKVQHLTWNFNVTFTIIPILNQINPILCTHINFFEINSNIDHLLLGLPRGLFPLGLSVKILKALLQYSILPACPPYLKFNLHDYVR